MTWRDYNAPFALAPRSLMGRTRAASGTSHLSCVARSAGSGGVGSSGQSPSSDGALVSLRASQSSAQMFSMAAAVVRTVGDEGRAPPLPPRPDWDLPLARSAGFLARCVANRCSVAALSAGPVSQEGSLAAGGGWKRAWALVYERLSLVRTGWQGQKARYISARRPRELITPPPAVDPMNMRN